MITHSDMSATAMRPSGPDNEPRSNGFGSLEPICAEFLKASHEFADVCATCPDISDTERKALKARIFAICGQMIGLSKLEVLKASQSSRRRGSRK
jgi:hypothetical protein